MKKLILPLFFAALFLTSGATHAQNLGRIIRKTVVEPTRVANDIAQDKAEEEAEKRATKAIMEGFGINENANLDPEYKFDAWFKMQITDYKKNGKVDEQVEYDNYLNKINRDYGMEFREDASQSIILFDSSRFAMIVLTDDDGEKTGFATGMDPDKVDEIIKEDSPDEAGLKPLKTGNTKKILGYSCDEYLIEDEESEVRMWVSEELGKEMHKEILNNPNAFGSTFHYSSAVNGMILEYTLLEKNTGEKNEMLVTDLDLNRSHSISTQGYAIISMNLEE